MVPILYPIMLFSKRLDMLSISVTLLQYQGQVLSENSRFISLKELKLWMT